MRKDNLKKQKLKEIRALEDEWRFLWKTKHNLGYTVLDKPLHDGWYKHLRLRDDISRRKDVAVFEEILEATSNKIWGRERKGADKNWIKANKDNKELQFPGIRKLQEKKYEKLSEKAKKWFHAHNWYRTPWRGYVKRYHSTVPRYYFVITYSKAYITKRRIIDPELNQRIQEIEEILISPKYYKYYQRGHGYRDFMDDYKRKRRKAKVELGRFDVLYEITGNKECDF